MLGTKQHYCTDCETRINPRQWKCHKCGSHVPGTPLPDINRLYTIVGFIEKGYSISEMGRALGISRQAIHEYLLKNFGLHDLWVHHHGVAHGKKMAKNKIKLKLCGGCGAVFWGKNKYCSPECTKKIRKEKRQACLKRKRLTNEL